MLRIACSNRPSLGRLWAPQAGWNGKVRSHHGFGMGVGFAQNNTIAANNLSSSECALGKGFLVTRISTLTETCGRSTRS